MRVVVAGEQRLVSLFAADGRIVQQADDLIGRLGVIPGERPGRRRAPVMSRPIGGSPRVPGTRAMVPAPMMLMLLMMCACFPDGTERASRAGEPGWVPASDEMFGARQACEGGAGGDSARAWRRLGPPADHPGPGQRPVLLPRSDPGDGGAAALHRVSVAAGGRGALPGRGPSVGRGPGSCGVGRGRPSLRSCLPARTKTPVQC